MCVLANVFTIYLYRPPFFSHHPGIIWNTAILYDDSRTWNSHCQPVTTKKSDSGSAKKYMNKNRSDGN